MKKIILFILCLFLISLLLILKFVGIKQYNKNENSFEPITIKEEIIDDNEDYFMVVNGNATYRTDDINELYNKADLVVIADYINDKNVSIQKNASPITLSTFKIIKTIKNNLDFKLKENIEVQYIGGVITLKQLLDSRDESFASKLGLDKNTITDSSNLKVQFNIDSELGDKSLKEHKTRLLLLSYNTHKNVFEAIQNGYGMLSYNLTDNTAYDFKNGKYIAYSFLK